MITKETMSHTLRRMFVKEADAPIQVVQDPYFLYLVDLFDEYVVGLKERLDLFLDCVNQCGGEQAFGQESSRLRDTVIAHIADKMEYEAFCNADMSLYKTSGEKANLYTKDNDGQAFISVDLVKANFAAMRRFSPALVDGATSYVDFISQFTDFDHFRKSRQVRQYIFGNLNPKRQMTIARYMIGLVSNAIKEKYPNEQIVASSHDEVVVTTKTDITGNAVENLVSTLSPTVQVKIEEFVLERIGDHPFYLKQFDMGAFELKAVPEYFLPQVYKHVRGLSINDMDMTFFFEGKIARFLQPLEF